jgi:hypothetical protein
MKMSVKMEMKFLMVGLAQIVTTLIHGVTVDVVYMIQHVILQLASGITATLVV